MKGVSEKHEIHQKNVIHPFGYTLFLHCKLHSLFLYSLVLQSAWILLDNHGLDLLQPLLLFEKV